MIITLLAFILLMAALQLLANVLIYSRLLTISAQLGEQTNMIVAQQLVQMHATKPPGML